MTTHVITGGTGFVGAAMILELLRQDPQSTIIGIVRAGSDSAATARLKDVLIEACDAYQAKDLEGAINDNVRAIPGDITKPLCGIDVNGLQLDGDVAVWHCAASLQFREKRRDVINLHNVEGTVNIIELAGQLNAQAYNHVSTAYVAGRAVGEIAESAVGDLNTAHNAYERSKITSESAAWETCKNLGIQMKLLRPSVVVGHSITGVAFNHSGMYGMARGLLSMKILCAKAGMTLKPGDVNLLADEDMRINFIPIDIAARNAVGCGLRGEAGLTYHISNDYLTPLADGLDVVSDLLGIPRLEFASSAEELSGIGQMLDNHLDFYRSYISGTKKFATDNVKRVMGADASWVHVSNDFIAKTLGIYFDLTRPTLERKLQAT